ncbi:NAD(+) diphosphatase [Parafrankia sp. EUN1f]|uniref:NAD(+) diphosphatase n=1 Tax=Parafrankia sp. EUN1f TaxID=102897 RepID=UPI0001C43F36|nr:NAD(+) diphosphatase [Parafrankia sp. EUN1f]EFC83008.1 NAD(+) diphosphatase [Parafrankia sp. EUN1f]
MSGFGLVASPVLAGAPIVRDGLLRLDSARREASWAAAQVVVTDDRGRFPIDQADGPPRLRTYDAAEIAAAPPSDALLLGEADSVVYWGIRAPAPSVADFGGDDPAQWLDLFTVGADFPAVHAALAATATALLNWHGRARFCARDGSPTHVTNGGWARVCEAEQHEEYPRTDPAVICLVHDGADRVLLARQRVWPAGRFSVLAGFVEAGESLEACVAREMAEEVGVAVRDIGYLGSQTWPFPRSLMIGFQAVADPEAPLRLDDEEIVEAQWVTLDELRPALARTAWPAAGTTADGQLYLPGRLSIARTMIDAWALARTAPSIPPQPPDPAGV